MSKPLSRFLVPLVLLTALVVTSPVFADASKFSESSAAKEKDQPQEFLPDYDKLVEGKKADWVWYAEGANLKSFKIVGLKPFATNGKSRDCKDAAEDGLGYLDQWIEKSPLGWTVAKKGSGPADLTIEGNVFYAWEPSAAASFWGGGLGADPTVGIELIGRDKAGKIVFEVRHKRKGSTMTDAVENNLEDIVETLGTGK